jgi:hypothetical protein
VFDLEGWAKDVASNVLCMTGHISTMAATEWPPAIAMLAALAYMEACAPLVLHPVPGTGSGCGSTQ